MKQSKKWVGLRAARLGRMGARLALLSAACGLAGCSGDVDTGLDGEAVGESVEAVRAPGGTRLNSIANPVRLSRAIAGQSQAAYLTQSGNLAALRYVPVTLSGVLFPNSVPHFSSVYQRIEGVTASVVRQGLTHAQYTAEHNARVAAGYQPQDVSMRIGPNGEIVYDAIFVQRSPQQTTATWRNADAASLTYKIAELKAQGLRPTRIHAVKTSNGTRFSAVFVKDSFGTDFRANVEQTLASFNSTFVANRNEGYYLVDLSVHYSGNERRYNAIYVRSPQLSDTAYTLDTGAEIFESSRVYYANAGYVLSDVEAYPNSATSNTPAFASVWVRNLPASVSWFDSNLSTTGISGAAKTAIDDIVARLPTFNGRPGLFIEDLTNGNYFGFRSHDPQYLASTVKVFVAATVLDQVDRGLLSLSQTLNVLQSDIFETVDRPSVPGSYTIDQLIRFMLNESSTNATDRLLRHIGAAAVNEFVLNAGLTNIGEITTICELDRRIYEPWKSCVRNLACAEFEQWLRQKKAPTSVAGKACLTGEPTAVQRDILYKTYYASFANTGTPFEFARFWRRLLERELLTDATRNYLIEVMDATGDGVMTGYTPYYSLQALKGGSKYRSRSYVGIGHDSAGAAGAAGDIGQYSFAVFAEDWANETEALTLMRAIRNDGLMFLKARR